MRAFNIEKMRAIIHQTKTPPHSFGERFVQKTKRYYVMNFQPTKEQLLPFPYQTNCYSYDRNSIDTNAHKSREYCILDYMQKLEYEKYKCNRKWFYSSFANFKDSSHRFCQTNNCSVQYNGNILNQKYRRNCYNE